MKKVGVVERGELSEEQQVVNQTDQAAEEDRAEAGDDADRYRDERKDKQVHGSFGSDSVVHERLAIRCRWTRAR